MQDCAQSAAWHGKEMYIHVFSAYLRRVLGVAIRDQIEGNEVRDAVLKQRFCHLGGELCAVWAQTLLIEIY